MDIYAVLTAVAAAVNTIDGGPAAYPVLPDAIDPPTFGSGDFEMDYHLSFSESGLRGLPVTFLLFTSEGDTEAGRQLLSSYLNPTGATSIRKAIEADQTLGGTATAVVVDRCRNAFRLAQVGENWYLGAEIDIRVWGT